ncbi:three-Cys-motif partner protein TcmP [Aeromicrobium sp.]|uniref:three-Cys-motif partner protein TcmP n=1 Tax=Aeromicrobium sp. TaxID=1871063 RepID=UPI0030EB744D
MVANDQFFQRPKPAAVLKHAVLREYLTVFTAMVGSTANGPVWLLDGYAGPGYYEAEAGDDPMPGSPVVALEVAQKWGHKRDLRCVFIEKSPKHALSLEANVRPFVEEGLTAEVLQGQVQDKFANAWSLIDGGPVLTFLDPFGVGMDRSIMTDNLLEQKRPEPSEVLLNINVEAVSRLGGWLESVDGVVCPKSDIHSAAGVERVDRFLGGEEWRTEFFHARANGNAAEAAESVVRAYCARIEEETGFKSISIPVVRRPNNPVLFLLTLFFTSPAAGYKFADAAARATRKWRDVYRQVELEDRLTNVATRMRCSMLRR